VRTFIALTFSSFFSLTAHKKKSFKASVDIEERKREGEREGERIVSRKEKKKKKQIQSYCTVLDMQY
jgi:hypothetical protein